MTTSSNPSASGPATRDSGILLLILTMIGLAGFGLTAAPVWLVCVPFVLLAMQEGGANGWLGRSSNEGNQKGCPTIGARIAGPLFHLVVIATVVVAHGKLDARGGNRQIGEGGGCGCGAMADSQSRPADSQSRPTMAASGCGCGAGKGGGGCGCGREAADSQSRPTMAASGCG